MSAETIGQRVAREWYGTSTPAVADLARLIDHHVVEPDHARLARIAERATAIYAAWCISKEYEQLSEHLRWDYAYRDANIGEAAHAAFVENQSKEQA